MGYTHYFKMDGKLEEFFVDEVRDIIAQAERDGIALAGYDGEGTPVVTEDEIALNGSAALGQEYESFILPTDYDGAGFCKTAHMPYDAVVTAILVSAIVNKLGDDISSDGTYADWKDGIALYEKAVRKLTPSERQRVRRTLNHEFRPSIVRLLSEKGFDVKLVDRDNGIYEIRYMSDQTQIAARGIASVIAYDALESKTGKYCRSLQLSGLLGKLVEEKSTRYYNRNGYYGNAFDWHTALCY